MLHVQWFAVLVVSVALTSVAVAEERDVVAAAQAFERAQRAEATGDYAQAAEQYELADRMAPTPEALRAATRARLNADQLVAAATLAEELLRRYALDAPSRELAEQVLDRTRPELGRLLVSCSKPCTLLINDLASGVEARERQTVYVTPGASTLAARFPSGAVETRHMDVHAGETLSLSLAPSPEAEARASAAATVESEAAPAAGPRSTAEASRGLSPLYFWSGVGVTAVLGAVTLWSGIDTKHAADDVRGDPNATLADWEDGNRKDLRTNVLIGATAALAAGTAALAFFTDWHARDTRPALSLGPQGGQLSLAGSF